MTKQRILIPLDASAFSREIIPSVQQLFRPQDVELVLLRVALQPVGMVPDPPRAASTAWMTPLYQSADDAARAKHPIYASQMEASAEAYLVSAMLPEIHALEEAGYTVAHMAQFGEPVAVIITAAIEQRADLIAMATHSRTGISHVLLGSVAERVLRQAHIPLLLIHPQQKVDFGS